MWAQRLRRPARQWRQRPQTTWPSPLTRSPGRKSATLLPISTISPTNSWPMTIGGWIVRAAHASQPSMWRSVPQIPVLWTRMRTSLIPISGSGTVSRLSPGPGPGLHECQHRSSSPAGRRGCGDEVSGRLGPRRSGRRPVDDRILHPTDPLDLDPGAIAGLEEDRRVPEHADPGRRPRRDDVTRLEGDVGADELDQGRDVEDHVPGPALLHQDRRPRVRAAAGDPPGADREIGRPVELVGGHEDRADREERVRALRPEPLAVAVLALAQGRLAALEVAGARRR